MYHIVTHEFMVRPHRGDGTAGQIDGEAGWYTTSGKIGLSPLARVKGVDKQKQQKEVQPYRTKNYTPIMMLKKRVNIIIKL